MLRKHMPTMQGWKIFQFHHHHHNTNRFFLKKMLVNDGKSVLFYPIFSFFLFLLNFLQYYIVLFWKTLEMLCTDVRLHLFTKVIVYKPEQLLRVNVGLVVETAGVESPATSHSTKLITCGQGYVLCQKRWSWGGGGLGKGCWKK